MPKALFAIFLQLPFPIISSILNLKNMIVNHFFFLLCIEYRKSLSYKDTNTNIRTCLHLNMGFKKLQNRMNTVTLKYEAPMRDLHLMYQGSGTHMTTITV